MGVVISLPDPSHAGKYFLGYFPKLWKQENWIYLKKPDKESYHLENSYCSISFSNILGKINEGIILQQATNILEENNFLKGKNLYAYQKNKNASQALLPLIEKMCEELQVANMTLQFLLICRVLLMQCRGRRHYISCTKQISLTIFSQSFPAFSQTDSIET